MRISRELLSSNLHLLAYEVQYKNVTEEYIQKFLGDLLKVIVRNNKYE